MEQITINQYKDIIQKELEYQSSIPLSNAPTREVSDYAVA